MTSDKKEGSENDEDLNDMLIELRILLPSSQLLTAFLITLPFTTKFERIVQSEKWVFMATFVSAMMSLIIFTAPAVQHRLMRPLQNRIRFKHVVTRQMLAGAACLSVALVMGTDLVMAEVFGHLIGAIVSGLTALLVAMFWWLFPKILKRTVHI